MEKIFTELEQKAMNHITYVQDQEEPDFSTLMVEDVAKAIGESIPTTKGVIGSLVKKGVIFTLDNECQNPAAESIFFIKKRRNSRPPAPTIIRQFIYLERQRQHVLG